MLISLDSLEITQKNSYSILRYVQWYCGHICSKKRLTCTFSIGMNGTNPLHTVLGFSSPTSTITVFKKNNQNFNIPFTFFHEQGIRLGVFSNRKDFTDSYIEPRHVHGPCKSELTQKVSVWQYARSGGWGDGSFFFAGFLTAFFPVDLSSTVVTGFDGAGAGGFAAATGVSNDTDSFVSPVPT